MNVSVKIDTQKELLAYSYGLAQSYTNLVIGAGYAGTFALWAFVRDDLSRLTSFSAATLLLLSLSGFVLWEVYCMYYRSQSLLSLSKVLSQPERFDELMAEFKRQEHDKSIKHGRLWIRQLYFVVITAIGAVLVLLSAFFHGIWHAACGA